MAPKILVVDDNPELLTLLTQLFDEMGYQVLAASKGKQALELAEEKPELAILDILLPDIMGYHLADALRKQLPGLPLIFITGVFKGGKHAAEAKNKHGVAGYFEKPFEAQKLLDAVKALVPPGEIEGKDARAADAFEVELDIDVEEDDPPQDAMELTGRIKVMGGGDLRAELRGANLTATAPAQSTAIPRPTPPGRVAPAVFEPPPAPGSRRGELKDNLPSLITAFFLARETGELGIQRGKVKKVVYFEKGQPVFALSNLVSDRFGQFLVRTGKIRAEQLQDAAAVATQSRRRTGDVLIERGLLKETERMFYVGQQVKAIIYSLFGWDDGSWVMSFRDRAAAESIKLDVHPASLIVRGVKKLYKLERLRRLVPLEVRLIPSQQPSYALEEVERERWEGELLPKVDGTKTVAELLAITGRPEAAVLGFLHAMSALNILEQRADT